MSKATQLRDVQDVLYILGGRWRGAVLASLCGSPKRFNELQQDVGSITPRSLSKELLLLQEHKLVERNGLHYQLTGHGNSLQPLIAQLAQWGQKHRSVFLEEG